MELSPVEQFHAGSETFQEFHMVSLMEEVRYPGRKDCSMISFAICWLLPGLILGSLPMHVPFPVTLNSNDWQLSGTMLAWTLLNKETFFATTSKYLIAYWCCQQINTGESFPWYSAQVVLMTLYSYSGLQVTSLRNCSSWETSSQIVLDHGNDKMYYRFPFRNWGRGADKGKELHYMYRGTLKTCFDREVCFCDYDYYLHLSWNWFLILLIVAKRH